MKLILDDGNGEPVILAQQGYDTVAVFDRYHDKFPSMTLELKSLQNFIDGLQLAKQTYDEQEQQKAEHNKLMAWNEQVKQSYKPQQQRFFVI